jgi:hypothetical protein
MVAAEQLTSVEDSLDFWWTLAALGLPQRSCSLVYLSVSIPKFSLFSTVQHIHL